MTLVLNWLTNKLIHGENGIIFDCEHTDSFGVIQDFIEIRDLCFKTPAIYYQAFPEESAAEFLNTLGEELIYKLGRPGLDYEQSLSKTIQEAELKMVVIDKCHLHPQDTLQSLLNFFSDCNVAVVLVGSCRKMAIAQILSNPLVFHWDTLEIADKRETTAKFC